MTLFSGGKNEIKRIFYQVFRKSKNTVSTGQFSCARIEQGKCRKNEGFTYVETLSVLAIGAILTATAVISGSKIISIARRTSAESQIQQFSTALQTYFLDVGRFPTTEQGIQALWNKPDFFPVPQNWNGPYLDKKPSVDPWGNEYQYYSKESSPLPFSVPQNLPFVIMSFGSDGVEGGEGDGCDIVSWE